MFRWLFQKRLRNQEIDDEFEAHLALEAKLLEERALSREQAHSRAPRSFGNQSQLAERTREVWVWLWFDRLRQDLRYAVRTLLRNHAFTLAAVLSRTWRPLSQPMRHRCSTARMPRKFMSCESQQTFRGRSRSSRRSAAILRRTRSFVFPTDAKVDLLTTLSISPDVSYSDPMVAFWHVYGRLKPGVSVPQAPSRLGTLVRPKQGKSIAALSLEGGAAV